MSRDSSARRSAGFNKVATKLNERTAKGHVIEATLQFITPMFGGGVTLNKDAPHLKEYDQVTPVRGASLRGQLRAWWRRTCDPALDPATLKKREAVLWGWASTQEAPAKGLVALSVDSRRLHHQWVDVYMVDNPRKPIDDYGAPLAYGAFPLQPGQGAPDRSPGRLSRWTGQFTVRLELLDLHQFKDYQVAAQAAWSTCGDDLETRLREELQRTWDAFVTFGGLGGRTRRGFGAVAQTHPAPDSLDDVVARLGWTDRLVAFEVTANEAHPKTEVATELAQKRALGRLQAFRQGVRVGRGPAAQGSRSPAGRSFWPEPDLIRRVRNTHLVDDNTGRTHAPVHKVAALPRVSFGLPIIVKFLDDRTNRNSRDFKKPDPEKQTIQVSEAIDRLASPILLRSVATADPAVAYAIALRLPTREPLDRILKSVIIKQGKAANIVARGLLDKGEPALFAPLQHHVRPDEVGVDAVLNSFLRFFVK